MKTILLLSILVLTACGKGTPLGPKSSPSPDVPAYVGSWDWKEPMPGAACSNDPAYTDSTGHSILGNHYVIKADMSITYPVTPEIAYTFDGATITTSLGFTYGWTQESATTAIITYTPNCAIRFFKMGVSQ